MDDFEPSPQDNKQLRKTLEGVGYFIHNFAAVELLVACWILALSSTRARGRAILRKEKSLDDRVKRLATMVREHVDLETSGMPKELEAIYALRQFRNQVAHAAAGFNRSGKLSLVGYKQTIPISPQIVADHSRRAGRIMLQLNAYHVAKFGEGPALKTAAEAAPPPID